MARSKATAAADNPVLRTKSLRLNPFEFIIFHRVCTHFSRGREKCGERHAYFGNRTLVLQTKKRMFGRLLRRQPELYNFKHNRGGVGHRDPDADSLDWESGPGTNAQTYHLFRLIAPPLIRY